ncbi:MAG TPA: tetratricopeptide repeat protein [Usitatibacter sp.]|nr:tetratricopeptide repeat protein [Usitatibacter sp.]
MSLLLDALKRAEQEKLAKQGDRPANDSPAAPASAAAARREPANAPSLELQPIASAAGSGAANASAAHAKSGAATAQAVFQAKAAPSQKPQGASKATVLWIAGVMVLILIIGIGGYVWWSLASLPPAITTLRPRPAPTPPPASGIPLPNKLDTLVPGAIAPGASRQEAQPPATATLPPPTPAVSSPAPRVEDPAPAPRATAELAARLVRDAPATPSLRTATPEKARVPTEVAVGYDALRTGDLPTARRSYLAALAADPSSLDAQLGLATIEARLGNAAAAANHYRRALDLDPRNATALAGLASIADMSQPEILEGQLRADLARHPQSAALHFALGNLYASRARWEEAQGAYFEALRLDPASADILYNLAVAMDHMGQSRLAADYYRRALEAARGQSAQFDAAAAQRRLAELRP